MELDGRTVRRETVVDLAKVLVVHITNCGALRVSRYMCDELLRRAQEVCRLDGAVEHLMTNPDFLANYSAQHALLLQSVGQHAKDLAKLNTTLGSSNVQRNPASAKNHAAMFVKKALTKKRATASRRGRGRGRGRVMSLRGRGSRGGAKAGARARARSTSNAASPASAAGGAAAPGRPAKRARQASPAAPVDYLASAAAPSGSLDYDDVAPVAKPDFDSVDLSFMSQGSGQDDWAASQDTASLQAQSRREAQELERLKLQQHATNTLMQAAPAPLGSLPSDGMDEQQRRRQELDAARERDRIARQQMAASASGLLGAPDGEPDDMSMFDDELAGAVSMDTLEQLANDGF